MNIRIPEYLYYILISHIYSDFENLELVQDGSQECLEVAYPARFHLNCLGR